MGSLFDYTNMGAYFIWEATKHENALDVWYCAEDIGSYFERYEFLNIELLDNIISSGADSQAYLDFIRNIAYRIYVYTEQTDSLYNWFITENLVKNREWLEAIVGIANCFRESKNEFEFIKNIRSETVRNYYYPFSQKQIFGKDKIDKI